MNVAHSESVANRSSGPTGSVCPDAGPKGISTNLVNSQTATNAAEPAAPARATLRLGMTSKATAKEIWKPTAKVKKSRSRIPRHS